MIDEKPQGLIIKTKVFFKLYAKSVGGSKHMHLLWQPLAQDILMLNMLEMQKKIFYRGNTHQILIRAYHLH